jgi:hypothetical protein
MHVLLREAWLLGFSDRHIGFLPDTIDEYAMAYLLSATDGQRADLSAVR